MRQVKNETERLAVLIHTATQWHSDAPDGRACLSLGSTRKINNEEHRASLLREIDDNLAYRESPWSPEEDRRQDIADLNDLREQVVLAKVDTEWLSGHDYCRTINLMHDEGRL